MFFYKKFLFIIFISIFIIFFISFKNPMFDMNDLTWKMTGLIAVMVLFWVFEIMPMGITALIPIIYAPLMGLDNLKNITASYGNPIIFLFLGGFVIGIAMEKWNLHKRISLYVLSIFGSSKKKQLFGFMMVAAFLSMWLSNTAMALMLLPVVMAVILNYEDTNENKIFGKALLIGLAYAVNIGGFATLIGTPPNVILRGFLEKQYNIELSFLDWMLFATPLSLILFFLAYYSIVYFFKVNKISENKEANKVDSKFFRQELEKLGNISTPEKVVAMVFIVTASFWIGKEYINSIFNIGLSDEIIAVTAIVALFIIPVNLANKEFAMDLKSFLSRVPWDILLLFGGGLALSDLFVKTGFSEWIRTSFTFIHAVAFILIVLVIVGIMTFATEITSNAGATIIFLPIIAAIAADLGSNPIILAIAVTIASSCAFILPIATPPNAIVFSSGRLSILDMFKIGILLNLIAIICISIYAYYLVELFFN